MQWIIAYVAAAVSRSECSMQCGCAGLDRISISRDLGEVMADSFRIGSGAGFLRCLHCGHGLVRDATRRLIGGLSA